MVQSGFLVACPLACFWHSASSKSYPAEKAVDGNFSIFRQSAVYVSLFFSSLACGFETPDLLSFAKGRGLQSVGAPGASGRLLQHEEQ